MTVVVASAGGMRARRRFSANSALVSDRSLVAALFGMLGLQNVALWRFIGFTNLWALLCGAIVAVAIALAVYRRVDRSGGIGARDLIISVGVALVLCVLAGEGRFVHQTFDWQIRDAVLHDMASYPWPFAYTTRGAVELLRAPIGMYLAPGAIGLLGGVSAAEYTLLIQNTLVLALIFALGSRVFSTGKGRLIALAVFILFSGLDVIGQLLVEAGGGQMMDEHLETWANLQYSAHITQLFWVPHHALSSWAWVALFALWRIGRLRVGVVLAAVPLIALWSPLTMIGVLPFAVYASLISARSRELRFDDLALAGAATLLSIPALLYLHAGSGSLGLHLTTPPWQNYVVFEVLEVVPLIRIALMGRRDARFDGWTLAIVTVMLVLLPFGQIGKGLDFMMRVSIPALALLALAVADVVVRLYVEPRENGLYLRRGVVVTILAIGAGTGFQEIRRELSYVRPPQTACSLPFAWRQAMQGYRDDIGYMSTYLAPVLSLPRVMRPTRVDVVPFQPWEQCWVRPWFVRR